MTTIERSIVIDAPVEQVFEYMTDPAHLPEIWPSLVEVKDVKPLPNGGHSWHWLYKMAGLRFEGDSETIELEPEKHLVSKATGQLPAKFDYRFEAEDGRTRIQVKTEYEIPEGVLAKFARPFILKLNEREADVFLANLKDRLEK